MSMQSFTIPQHGGDIYTQEILWDFSINVNPLGPPSRVKAAVRQSAEHCVCYPDPHCRELTAAIAAYYHVEKEDILCGNGAADLLYQLVFALIPRHAIIPVPTFTEYAHALGAVKARITPVILTKENGFAITADAIKQQILIQKNKGNPPDILCLCNPNNPTGLPVSRADLLDLAEFTKKQSIIFLLDECFTDFLDTPGDYSLLSDLNAFPNLIILKAFTKIYGMPGLRLGFFLTKNHTVLEKIRAVRQPWSVSTPAQMAGVAALQEGAYLKKTRQIIAQGRIQLSQGLTSLGFLVYPSKANYLFFQDLRKDAKDAALYYACLNQKLLLRSCANYPGLDSSYYRVCIKTEPENTRLFYLLQEVLETASAMNR